MARCILLSILDYGKSCVISVVFFIMRAFLLCLTEILKLIFLIVTAYTVIHMLHDNWVRCFKMHFMNELKVLKNGDVMRIFEEAFNGNGEASEKSESTEVKGREYDTKRKLNVSPSDVFNMNQETNIVRSQNYNGGGIDTEIPDDPDLNNVNYPYKRRSSSTEYDRMNTDVAPYRKRSLSWQDDNKTKCLQVNAMPLSKTRNINDEDDEDDEWMRLNNENERKSLRDSTRYSGKRNSSIRSVGNDYFDDDVPIDYNEFQEHPKRKFLHRRQIQMAGRQKEPEEETELLNTPIRLSNFIQRPAPSPISSAYRRESVSKRSRSSRKSGIDFFKWNEIQLNKMLHPKRSTSLIIH